MVFKKIGRILGYLVVGVFVLVALSIGFLETAPGKRVLTGLVEKIANAQINGRLTLGSIRGNFFRHIVLSKLNVTDSRGHSVAKIGNIVVDHRIHFFSSPHLIIHNLRIEQPKLAMVVDKQGVSNWSKLAKQSDKKKPAEKKTASSNEKPTVWLQSLQLDQGSFTQFTPRGRELRLYPINAHFLLPLEFRHLPTGEVFVGGDWRGMPVKIASSLKWSGGRKTASQAGRDQSVALLAELGRSLVEISGEGDFNLEQWVESDARVTMNRLHYDAAQLRKKYPGGPKQPIDAKAFVAVKHRAADFGLESHVANTAKLIVEGSGHDLPSPATYELKRFRFDGECPLLQLARPSALTLKKDDPAPIGDLELNGCAGKISYKNGTHGLTANIDQLDPDKILKAFSIPPMGLGIIHLAARLPEGASVPHAFLHVQVDTPKKLFDQPSQLTLDAALRNSRLNAKASSKIGAHEFAKLTADMAQVLAPGTWTATPKRAQGKMNLVVDHFDLHNLSGKYKGMLTAKLAAHGSLAQTNLNFDGKGEKLVLSQGLPAIDFNAQAAYDALRAKANIDFTASDLPKAAPQQKKRGRALAVQQQMPTEQSHAQIKVEMAAPQARLLKEGSAFVKKAQFTFAASANHFDVSKFISQSRVAITSQPRIFVDLDSEGSGIVGDPDGVAKLSVSTDRGKLIDIHARFSPDELDAQLVSKDAALDPLLAYLPVQVKADSAKLNSDFHLKGSPQSPQYSGFIRVNAEKIVVTQLDTIYRKALLDIAGNSRQIDLRQLLIESGGSGKLQAKGNVTLAQGKNPETAKFDVLFENFQALSGEKMKLTTNGTAALTANRADSSFSGHIDIKDGEIRIPDDKQKSHVESLGELDDVTTKEEPTERQSSPGIFSPLHGTITINAPGRFWVKQSTDIAIELAAHLDTGIDTDGDTFLTGRVNTRRGYTELFGHHFDINRGILTFEGDPSEPRVDAEAYYKATPTSIIVDVRGTYPDFKPHFSSDPSGYGEDQCIGILLTGSPDFQKKGGGGGGSLAGPLTGYLAGEAKKMLGPKLPFDTFTANVASEGSAKTRDDASKVEVGKYVSDRIFVKLGHEFGSEYFQAQNTFTMDYSLSDKWSLETTESDQGRSDLQALWTRNY